jgi:hypothetical protein
MSRSRSSFDLAGAIATAASLSTVPTEEEPAAVYRGMALVSFGPTAAGPPTVVPPDPAEVIEQAAAPARGVRPIEPPDPPAVAEAHPLDDAPAASDPAKRPPKLPDLSGIQSPTVRCQRILAWITEAVGATGVFIADASGLPVAGAVGDAEALLAAAGIAASSIAHLAAAIPGNTSSIFELHVGEGPFLQLVGFDVSGALHVVGFSRSTPLSYRQAHAVRLACRHALGEPIHEGEASAPGVEPDVPRPRDVDLRAPSAAYGGAG